MTSRAPGAPAKILKVSVYQKTAAVREALVHSVALADPRSHEQIFLMAKSLIKRAGDPDAMDNFDLRHRDFTTVATLAGVEPSEVVRAVRVAA